MRGRLVLIVDDEACVARYLESTLSGAGYRTRVARNGVEGLLAIERERPDLVLSDLKMPEMDGLELLRHVRQRWPDLPLILVTVVESIDTVVHAVRMGAVNYLIKASPPEVILSAVERACRSASGGGRPADSFDEIVGTSRSMVEARHLIALAARSDVNVLITGRTGTGKELAARAIHRASSLSDGPFVAVNCAAVPSDLFESTFFGHRKGAFTGADRDATGLLEAANGGVLLLDELESLAPAHQAKLLRFLDDGEVRPVGASLVRHADVRVLAASNMDPAELLESSLLREDLYFRIRGFEIHLPDLRERASDIPHLAAHFLGADGPRLSPEALDVLAAYDWPGNVRELRNVLARARALAGSGTIGPEHLALSPLRGRGRETPAGAASVTPTAAAPGASVTGTLRDIERQAVIEALTRAEGNRSRAARSLGIDRSTLRRKLKELALEGEDPPPRQGLRSAS